MTKCRITWKSSARYPASLGREAEVNTRQAGIAPEVAMNTCSADVFSQGLR